MSEMRPHEPTPASRRHAYTVAAIWIVVSIIFEIIAVSITFPPGNMTAQAQDTSQTIKVLTVLAIPVFFGVVVFLSYCLYAFRQPADVAELVSGPAAYGNMRVQVGWVVISAILVLAMAAYGTIQLASTNGATPAGPKGPANVAASEASSPVKGTLQVQVIAQQWYFTYRFPQYGGIETTHLELPTDTRVEFHVVSLDVVHSFWAYNLGVKADAVPGNDNIAYAATNDITGPVQVRCAELCGLWHGEMQDGSAKIVTGSEWTAWINQQTQYFASIQKYMPPYQSLYYPHPLTIGH